MSSMSSRNLPAGGSSTSLRLSTYVIIIISILACPTNMSYDTSVPSKCVCNKPSYTEAGSDCIETSVAQNITNNYAINNIITLKYNKELELKKNSDGSWALDNYVITNSNTISMLFLDNAYKCSQKQDTKACQVIANICVLHLYDTTNDACKIITDLSAGLPAASASQE